MKATYIVGVWACILALVIAGEGEKCCKYKCKEGDKICSTTLRKLGNVNMNGKKFQPRIQKIADGSEALKRENGVKVPSNQSMAVIAERVEQQMDASIENLTSDFKGMTQSFVQEMKANVDSTPSTCKKSYFPLTSTAPSSTIRNAEITSTVESMIRKLMTDETTPFVPASGSSNSSQNCSAIGVRPSGDDSKRTSCADVTQADAKVWNGTGGLFEIYTGSEMMEAYCDLTSDGGGWMVIQRRMDGSEDFQRLWNDYVNGFGNPLGEFWFGLEKLHQLTSTGKFELRIDLADWDGDIAYATYSNFSIGDSVTMYQLNIGEHRGTAADSLSKHRGMMFSTSDNDHDQVKSENCAQKHGGGWWFQRCLTVNLNGIYYNSETIGCLNGIEWRRWKEIMRYALKFTEMKIRSQG